MTKSNKQGLYIGGKHSPASSGEQFVTTNPATGETLAEVDKASSADVDRAVASAQQGFETWRRMTGTERARVLHKAVHLLRQRNRELAEIEVQDTGKPIQEAEAVDVVTGADAIEYFASLAPSLHGEHVDLNSAFFLYPP